MARRRVEVSKQVIEDALKNNPSAAAACRSLDMAFTTFIRRCREYGVYITNQGLKGSSKPCPKLEIPLEKIFNGEHLMYGQGLKKKLIKAGLKTDTCEICGIGSEWNGRSLTLQLDHIDGNRINNSLENLQILCPNCHSQTPTFSKGHLRKKEHC